MYDNAIIDTLRTAETPLRMRDIVTKLAPNDTHAFSAIGMTLTKLTRAGRVKRAKTDGRYWHYWLGSDEDELTQLRTRVATLEAAHQAATYIIEEARKGFTFSEHFNDLFMQELSGWDVARATLEGAS